MASQAPDQAQGLLHVIVTYLEMRAAPDTSPGPPPYPGARTGRIQRPSVAAYRFLYDGVGEPWLWHERRALSDAALAVIVQDPRLEFLVLSEDRRIAGFAELDRRDTPDVRLAYFGLLPAYIGHGLGPWLLGHAIHEAWQGNTRRLLVNTCTFDHPAALGLYQRMGFVITRSVMRRTPDPRLSGLLPLNAAPHIPLAW